MSHDFDENGNKKSDYYIARSLRTGDDISRAGNVYDVNLIFAKNNTESKYTEITYNDKNVTITNLNSEILNKLDDSLKAVE